MRVSYYELHNKVTDIKELAWGVKFDSILTIVDRLTKYTMFISLRKPQQHQYWHTPYCKNWTITGYQRSLSLTETSCSQASFEKLTAELRINHKMSTAYHSQMNEQSKQMNQTVETYLRHYVNRNQNNWVQLLSTAQFAYNNTQKNHRRNTISSKLWI
jgi:predicted transposase YbfD/YdcC